MVRPLLLVALMASFVVSTPAHAAKPTDKTVQKTLKTLITALRYKKDDLAAKQIGFASMAELIMQDYWPKVSADDRKKLTSGIEKIIRGISFPKGREVFEHVDAVRYEPIKIDGKRVTCRAIVVVHRNYKKDEIVIDWVLLEEGGKWKVADTIMVGESTAEAMYEDQVEPLLDEGGMPNVMKALNAKLAELKK